MNFSDRFVSFYAIWIGGLTLPIIILGKLGTITQPARQIAVALAGMTSGWFYYLLLRDGRPKTRVTG